MLQLCSTTFDVKLNVTLVRPIYPLLLAPPFGFYIGAIHSATMAISKLELLQAEVAKNKAAAQTKAHAKYIKAYTSEIKRTIDQLHRELKALVAGFQDDLSQVDVDVQEENSILQSCLNVIHEVESTPSYLPDQDALPCELAHFDGDEEVKKRWLERIRWQVG